MLILIVWICSNPRHMTSTLSQKNKYFVLAGRLQTESLSKLMLTIITIIIIIKASTSNWVNVVIDFADFYRQLKTNISHKIISNINTKFNINNSNNEIGQNHKKHKHCTNIHIHTETTQSCLGHFLAKTLLQLIKWPIGND